jgi:aspartate racemase
MSWRVLESDLAVVLRGVPLAPVGTSFRRWAHLLQRRAGEPDQVARLGEWARLLDGPDPPVGAGPVDPQRHRAADLRTHAWTLPVDRTRALLTGAPEVFRSGVDEALLAALAVAVARWRRSRGLRHTALLLDVERHGREEFAADVDLSRTVGWFTCQFPVRLDPGPAVLAAAAPAGPALGRLLGRIKEQLRAAPDRGLSYGLLRHLNADTAATLAALPDPQVRFNYLGRFGAEHSGLRADAGPGLPAGHALDINAWVAEQSTGPHLHLAVSWLPDVLDETSVRALAGEWSAALEVLAEQAQRPDAAVLSPADIPLVPLTQNQLDQLQAEFSTADRADG